ncbi:hypothetical protein T09_4552 [Trichinella sp. T9]|nr:hypothetical protein T09_4552 [Trichinella sp. T9]
MLKETFCQIEMLTFFYSSWCTYSGNLLIFIMTVAIENYKSESSLFNSFYGAFDFYMQTKEKKLFPTYTFVRFSNKNVSLTGKKLPVSRCVD